MNTIMRLVLVAMLLLVAVPAFSGEAVQMFKCEMDDDATEAQVKAQATDFLAKAKKIPGGEQIKVYVYFPVAVNATGEMDLMFMVVFPTFEEWGKFWDNYEGSEAAKADVAAHEWVTCPDSAVWEAIEVK